MLKKYNINDEVFVQGPYGHKGFLFFENILHYEVTDFQSVSLVTNSDTLTPATESHIFTTGKTVYILLDTASSGNFGHFFYESYIYLSDFRKYHNKFKNVVFIIKEIKQFHRKIFSYHGFEISNAIKNHDNFVGIFPRITSHITNKHSYRYEHLLERFYNELNDEFYIFSDKNIFITMFLRHKKIDNIPEFERELNTESIEDFLKNKQNTLVINSESNLNWSYEIDAIKKSKIIIFPEGSSYLAMGLYARNSKIICLGSSLSFSGFKRFEKPQIAHNFIKKTNEVYFITKNPLVFEPNDILPILNGKISCF